MALTDIDIVKLLVGDTARNPLTNNGNNPFLTNAEYQYFIDTGNNLRDAAKQAAISIALILSAVNTRERYGDVEVWSEVCKQYRAALNDLIKDKSYTTSILAMPWTGADDGNSLYDVNEIRCRCEIPIGNTQCPSS